MAEIAASIIGIAGAGISTVTALTNFSIAFQGSRASIDALAGRVSLTVTILQTIADTIEENAADLELKREDFWNTWSRVLNACKDNYEKLGKAVAKAKAPGSFGGELFGRLSWALGGEEEMRKLELQLDRSCEQIMMMQQVLQMAAQRFTAQRLDFAQTDAHKELGNSVQWIVAALIASGIVPDSRPAQHDHDTVLENVSVNAGITVNPPQLISELGNDDAHSDGLSQAVTIREPKADHFEAYYLIPRSLSHIAQPGRLLRQKPSQDDYMAVLLDILLVQSTDPNLQSALRVAKNGPDMEYSGLPEAATRTIDWVCKHRNGSPSDLVWSVAIAQEIQLIGGSRFRKSIESGFLLLLRGLDLATRDRVGMANFCDLQPLNLAGSLLRKSADIVPSTDPGENDSEKDKSSIYELFSDQKADDILETFIKTFAAAKQKY